MALPRLSFLRVLTFFVYRTRKAIKWREDEGEILGAPLYAKAAGIADINEDWETALKLHMRTLEVLFELPDWEDFVLNSFGSSDANQQHRGLDMLSETLEQGNLGVNRGLTHAMRAHFTHTIKVYNHTDLVEKAQKLSLGRASVMVTAEYFPDNDPNKIEWRMESALSWLLSGAFVDTPLYAGGSPQSYTEVVNFEQHLYYFAQALVQTWGTLGAGLLVIKQEATLKNIGDMCHTSLLDLHEMDTYTSEVLTDTITKCAGAMKVIDSLIRRSANPRARDDSGFEPMHFLAVFGSPGLIRDFAAAAVAAGIEEQGASWNIAERTLEKCLGAEAATAKFLGIKPKKTCTGATGALHLAVMRGHADAARALLETGVSAKTEKDSLGRTAWDVACMHRWAIDRMAPVFGFGVDDCPVNSTIPTDDAPDGARVVELESANGWRWGDQSNATARKCLIDVRYDLTPDDFYREYLSVQRPVIVRNALGVNWNSLREQWGFTTFLQIHGNIEFDTFSIPYANEVFGLEEKPVRTSLANFLMGMRQGKTEYIFARMAQEPQVFGSERLIREMKLPTFANDASFSHAPHEFYVGPAGSGAPVHVHDDAINTLVYGRKRWVLVPPHDAGFTRIHPGEWFEKVLPDMLEIGTAQECIQEAGDAIYVPEGWGHGIQNLAESVGYARRFTHTGVITGTLFFFVAKDHSAEVCTLSECLVGWVCVFVYAFSARLSTPNRIHALCQLIFAVGDG